MKTYFKFFPYVFLVLAVLFLFDGIDKIKNGEDYLLTFLFIGALIFMFFFQKWKYRNFTGGNKDK
jgi:hypothetical protein